MKATSASNTVEVGADDFATLRNLITDHCTGLMRVFNNQLFTTDACNLYLMFLANLPPAERQTHTCNCCKRFIEQFGGLAVITSDGHHSSVLWDVQDVDRVPEMYRRSLRAMAHTVAKAKIDGVFLWDKRGPWGTPATGVWTHLHVDAGNAVTHSRIDFTAEQMMAQKRQDYGTLKHGLADYSKKVLGEAVNLLKADALSRSEKFLASAEWLYALQERREQTKSKAIQRNLVWLAVATAPAGWCTPRSSMIGTLLDDLAAGKPFATVKRNFEEKTHGLRYQRPQAAPTAGNIKQAEKLIEKMNWEASFQRRYARLEELELVWKSRPAEPPQERGGMFGHLQAKGAAPARQQTIHPTVAATRMTWERFRRTVLPDALKIELLLAPVMSFAGMATATDPTAPPIIKWDQPEKRNPVTWYVYDGGSPAERWDLRAGAWQQVTGITLLPALWGGVQPERAGYTGAIFVLKDAREVGPSSLALFPEFLRNELHGVRATVEAYSQTRRLTGEKEASANGLMFNKNGNPTTIRVTNDMGTMFYQIDRWD